jgi:Ni,Fe-hydrogenase maturation factor
MAVKKVIFVAGNPLIEQDSLALRVAEQLQGKIRGIEFREIESLDALQEKEKQNLCIMDVAAGIKKVQLIQGIEKLQTKQPISSHDFDLAMQLKVLQKLGKLGKVEIIAVPARCDLKKATREVNRFIRELQKSA